MAFSTDTELRETAEKALSEAQDILGWAIDGLYEVGADDYWSGIVDRARRALGRAEQAPVKIGREAAGKVRDAARAGLHDASTASESVREQLVSIASRAIAFIAGLFVLPPILLLVAAYVILEGSGQASKFRAQTQRHYRTQAKRGSKMLQSIGASYGF